MSSTAKLTAEQIENLAKEIREFLLEHGLWQDVDIYFNGKRFTQHDPVTGKYYYNDREHLIEVADQPERHFEYVNPEHILSMSFEGPVCEMLYYRRGSKRVLTKISGRNGKLHSEHCDREKDEGDCRTGVSTFWNRVQREAVQGIQEEPRHHQWR